MLLNRRNKIIILKRAENLVFSMSYGTTILIAICGFSKLTQNNQLLTCGELTALPTSPQVNNKLFPLITQSLRLRLRNNNLWD